MTIRCKVHNKGPGAEVFFDVDGNPVTVQGGQTAEATVNEAMFKTLKKAFDDPNYRLNLIEAEVGGDEERPKDSKESATDLIGSTKTADELKADEGIGAVHTDEGPDTIEKLLADVEAERINFAQLRSRAKALLGNDFPSGTSPKKDEIVDLLHTAQRKKAGG